MVGIGTVLADTARSTRGSPTGRNAVPVILTPAPHPVDAKVLARVDAP